MRPVTSDVRVERANGGRADMRRRALTGVVGLLVLLRVLLAGGNRTATTVWADASSMDWDVQMQDPAHACPGQGTSNDDDGIIETGESPDVVSADTHVYG